MAVEVEMARERENGRGEMRREEREEREERGEERDGKKRREEEEREERERERKSLSEWLFCRGRRL